MLYKELKTRGHKIVYYYGQHVDMEESEDNLGIKLRVVDSFSNQMKKKYNRTVSRKEVFEKVKNAEMIMLPATVDEAAHLIDKGGDSEWVIMALFESWKFALKKYDGNIVDFEKKYEKEILDKAFGHD